VRVAFKAHVGGGLVVVRWVRPPLGHQCCLLELLGHFFSLQTQMGFFL
jgi:hypothetical protein